MFVPKLFWQIHLFGEITGRSLMDHLSDKPCLISHTLQKEVSEQYANKINQIGSYLFSFGY